MYHCIWPSISEHAEYVMESDRETQSNSKRYIGGFARGYAKIAGLNEGRNCSHAGVNPVDNGVGLSGIQ